MAIGNTRPLLTDTSTWWINRAFTYIIKPSYQLAKQNVRTQTILCSSHNVEKHQCIDVYNRIPTTTTLIKQTTKSSTLLWIRKLEPSVIDRRNKTFGISSHRGPNNPNNSGIRSSNERTSLCYITTGDNLILIITHREGLRNVERGRHGVGPGQSSGVGDHHWEGPTKVLRLCQAPKEKVDGVQKQRMAMMEEMIWWVCASASRGRFGATALPRTPYPYTRRHSLWVLSSSFFLDCRKGESKAGLKLIYLTPFTHLYVI